MSGPHAPRLETGQEACRETRLSIAINGTRELMMDLENCNNRLLAIKSRVLGYHDDNPVPDNIQTDAKRPTMDELDHMLSQIGVQIADVKRHIASLEEL